jgi:hypothetical protein
MILGRGESLILHGGASLAHGGSNLPGGLFLTNYRVVFEAGGGGPGAFTAYEQRIDAVWNVHAGATSKFLEGRREFLTIEGDRGRFVFQVTGSTAWANAIAAAKTSAPPPPPPRQTHIPPPPPGYGGQSPVVVHVQAPPAPQIMMHCRNCGNLYDATKGRCERCGAPPT